MIFYFLTKSIEKLVSGYWLFTGSVLFIEFLVYPERFAKAMKILYDDSFFAHNSFIKEYAMSDVEGLENHKNSSQKTL